MNPPRLSVVTGWLGLMTSLAIYPSPVQKAAPVYVTASLVDRNQLFIEDLSQDEIQILENGQPRKLEFMAKDEIPAVYCFLFDRNLLPESWEQERSSRTSVSVAPRDIAYELIDKHMGRQAIWVAAYDRQLEVALNFGIDGFRAKEAVQRLRGQRKPQESFLYGALLSSLRAINERSEKRRVLLLFLDTIDSESAGKGKPLKNLLASSNVELFVLSFASRLGSSRLGLPYAMNEAALKELAQATAGSAFFAAQYGDHHEDISRRIFNQVRTFYTFGFQSESPPDKPAALSIRCSRPGSRVTHHPTVPVLH